MKDQKLFVNQSQALAVEMGRGSRSLYASFGKRALDIVLCLAALPILLIVFCGVWIANLGSGRQVIFAQPRVGRQGEMFTCYKFQTMVNDADLVLEKICNENPEVKAEWESFQKLSDDPRVTRAGKFLRETSLDELPQLWNVLIGDMSIVGPRPFMEDQDALYRAAGGDAYYDVRPGITGLWQVAARNSTTFSARASFDNEYAKDISLVKDFRIIAATVGVMLSASGG